MKKVHVKRSLVYNIIANRYGSVAAMVEQFSHPSSIARYGEVKRSSVDRWIEEGIPDKGGKHEHQYLRFCALLDVDPLAIFDFRANGYFSEFAKLRRLFQIGKESLGAFGSLFELMAPNEFWPSDELAMKLYGRPWYRAEFSNFVHENSRDYALVEAQFGIDNPSHPRAVHIAYKRTDTPNDTMWRYYGTVTSIAGTLDLYTESGRHTGMRELAPCQISFRTYFGGRPVLFRLASLHPFEERVEPSSDRSEIITFLW